MTYLIITFNAGNYIENLLNSIQNGGNILIIDNGSTDNTLGILESKNIEYCENKKNGYAAGINEGLRLLKERNVNYVFVLNQDTKILNTEFDYKLFADYAVIQPFILNEDFTTGVDELKMNVYGFVYPYRFSKDIFFETREIAFFSGAGFIINMHKYMKIGEFNENYFMYYEDIDYAVKCFLSGEKILLYDKISLIHYYKNSLSSLKKIKLLLHSRKIFINKYFPGSWKKLLFMFRKDDTDVPVSLQDKINFSGYILDKSLTGFNTKQINILVRWISNLFLVPYGILLKIVLGKILKSQER